MQAIIITCYKDKKNLYRLIDSLYENSNIYIHIDKKSRLIDINEIKSRYANIYVIQKYKIVWGGYNHLLAIIDLLKIAKKNNNNDYFHIISGQDLLIKSSNDFLNFFRNNKKIYMSVTINKMLPKEIKARYQRGIINSNINYKNKLIKQINKIYSLFRKKNKIGKIENICKGMIWSSFPKTVCNYLIEYIEKDASFMKDLKHCIIPEEFFIQSIVMNSKYKKDVVNNNLRFTDWNYRNGSRPAYLDKSDYNRIMESNCFFARKIDSNISKELIEKIEIERK